MPWTKKHGHRERIQVEGKPGKEVFGAIGFWRIMIQEILFSGGL